MERVFRKIASYINQSPTSDEVQQLIVEWKSYLEQSIVCDSEMLTCIANTYKFDNRFKNYINQFSNEDLAEFYMTLLYIISIKRSINVVLL